MTEQNQKRPSTKDFLKKARPARRHHRINIRGDLVEQIELLEADLQRANEAEQKQANKRLANQSLTAPIIAEIEQLRDEMDQSWLELTLEHQGTGAWREFKVANPSRGDQYPEDEMTGVNFDMLIEFAQTCVVEPDDLDDEDWETIRKNASPGDLRDLAGVALGLHERAVEVPKSQLASAIQRRNAVNSELQELGV